MYTELLERTLFSHATFHDDDDNSGQLMGSAITLLIFVFLVVGMRVYCRAYLLRNMGPDDWTMIAAAVSMSGLSRCSGEIPRRRRYLRGERESVWADLVIGDLVVCSLLYWGL